MPSRPYAPCDRPGCGYPSGECSGACLSRPAAPLVPLREPGDRCGLTVDCSRLPRPTISELATRLRPVIPPPPIRIAEPGAPAPAGDPVPCHMFMPEVEWPVLPGVDPAPACPPCTGACNQGRSCVARASRPDPAPPRRPIARDVALVLAFASAAAASAFGALTPFQFASAAVLLFVVLLWAILSLDERYS